MFRTTSFLPALIACIGLLAACEAEPDDPTGPVDNRVAVPEPPAEGEGWQFETPEWIVPAGEERLFCYVPDFVVTEDVLVRGFKGFQSAGGHHVIALQSVAAVPPDTWWDCSNLATMSNLSPLVLTDAGNQSDMEQGFAVRVPAGTDIVIQSHYVNASRDDWLVRDVAQITLADPSEEWIEASYLVMNHGTMVLPEGPSSVDVNCTIPEGEDINVIRMLGHMHEQGDWIEIGGDLGTGYETFYLVEEWENDFRDNGPVERWDPAEPLVADAGDQFLMNCNFDNRTGDEVAFPAEMCAAVMVYYPARVENDGLIICSD